MSQIYVLRFTLGGHLVQAQSLHIKIKASRFVWIKGVTTNPKHSYDGRSLLLEKSTMRGMKSLPPDTTYTQVCYSMRGNMKSQPADTTYTQAHINKQVYTQANTYKQTTAHMLKYTRKCTQTNKHTHTHQRTITRHTCSCVRFMARSGDFLSKFQVVIFHSFGSTFCTKCKHTTSKASLTKKIYADQLKSLTFCNYAG